MKRLFILLVALSLNCVAEQQISIKAVIANTQREGLVFLDQGYRGSFAYTNGSYLVDERDKGEFEYTHARLNDGGIGGLLPKAQAIVVGIVTDGKDIGFRAPSVYLEKIPSVEKLMALKEVADFEKVLGAFRGSTDGWGSESEMHSSAGWMVFTHLKDGSLRVVTVFLWTVNRGKGWTVEHRKIGDGIFRPTGKDPRLEGGKAKEEIRR